MFVYFFELIYLVSISHEIKESLSLFLNIYIMLYYIYRLTQKSKQIFIKYIFFYFFQKKAFSPLTHSFLDSSKF